KTALYRSVQSVSLATAPLGFFGALIVIIIALLLFGVAIAVTLGPIALVIAAIVRSLRNSAATTAPGPSAPGMSFTMSSSTRVVSSSGSIEEASALSTGPSSATRQRYLRGRRSCVPSVALRRPATGAGHVAFAAPPSRRPCPHFQHRPGGSSTISAPRLRRSP